LTTRGLKICPIIRRKLTERGSWTGYVLSIKELIINGTTELRPHPREVRKFREGFTHS